MNQSQAIKRIVAIGGGHCNCQVLKMLKKLVINRSDVKLTLITENPVSYYSGMLPGSVSELYTEDDIKVHLEPLSVWSQATYVEKKVSKIVAAENRIFLEDGNHIDYDYLAINVGSKTRHSDTIKGIWEHSLTTRPINDLLPKIKQKEDELHEKKIVPTVIVCGAGAAGVELSFAFKERWSKLFEKEIKVTLLGAKDVPMYGSDQSTIN